MKPTDSILRRAKRIARELAIFFKGLRFYFFPTQRNLLLNLWYGFVHAKDVDAGMTADVYLNERLLFMEEELADHELPLRKRRLYQRFQYAVGDPSFYQAFIGFLETEPFSGEMSAELMDGLGKVRWPGLRRAMAGNERGGEDAGVNAQTGADGKMNAARQTSADGLTGAGGQRDADGQMRFGAQPAAPRKARQKRSFTARTYYIAAELYFELKHDTDGFTQLSSRMNQLAAFVKQEFKAHSLPATFNDLKKYSYKPVLMGKNMAKKGQLRICFRQIADYPDVFGTAIADRARKILEKYFE